MLNDSRWWQWLVRADVLLLVLAIVAGIAGAVLSGRFLGARAAATDASLRSRYETRSVVVAAADLAQGEPVDSTRLAVRRMPAEFLPADAVPAERAAELIGTRTAIRIRRGTPVVAAALQSGDHPLRLATVLTGERRALTIAVDQVNSLAGNLQPGDFVDVYYSRSDGADAVLVPLLQRVEVLATGATLRADENADPAAERNFSTITFGLTGTDAARIVLAQQSGSLSVVLRSPVDTSQLPLEPRSSRGFLLPPQRARTTAAGARIEVLVGGSGGLIPQRSWLAVGQGRNAAQVDPS